MSTQTYFYNLYPHNYSELLAETIPLNKKGKLEIFLQDERDNPKIQAIVLGITTRSFFLPKPLRNLIQRYNGIYTGKSRVQTPSTSIDSGTTA